jgi:hypothetical protein
MQRSSASKACGFPTRVDTGRIAQRETMALRWLKFAYINQRQTIGGAILVDAHRFH